MYKFFNDNFLHDFDLANWLFWKVSTDTFILSIILGLVDIQNMLEFLLYSSKWVFFLEL